MDPHIDILQRVREACAHGCFEVSYITNKDAHRCSQESASAIKEKESLQAANVELARAICDVCIVGS